MPNNLQILVYIRAMKDEVDSRIATVMENDRITDSHNVLNGLRNQKRQLISLEKFIKGGN